MEEMRENEEASRTEGLTDLKARKIGMLLAGMNDLSPTSTKMKYVPTIEIWKAEACFLILTKRERIALCSSK